MRDLMAGVATLGLSLTPALRSVSIPLMAVSTMSIVSVNMSSTLEVEQVDETVKRLLMLTAMAWPIRPVVKRYDRSCILLFKVSKGNIKVRNINERCKS